MKSANTIAFQLHCWAWLSLGIRYTCREPCFFGLLCLL